MNIVFLHERELYKPKDNTYGFELDSKGNVMLDAKGGITIAMEEVPVEMFKSMTTEHILEVQIGKAICSKEDNYCKDIGRKLSASRMKLTDLEVLDVVEYKDSRLAVLKEIDTTTKYVLRYKEGYRHVNLEEVFFE